MFLRSTVQRIGNSIGAYAKCSRSRSYSAIANSRTETVMVNCGTNGSISLDITFPPLNTAAAPIILYLPRGPLLPSLAPDTDTIALLSSASLATIVSINYRLDSTHKYPTPIHDVLHAYDWVTQHLVTRSTPPIRQPGPRTSAAATLGVCGELIGGSLATMLALTEARPSEPRIGALATSNAITDWIFPTKRTARPRTEKKSRADRPAPASTWFQHADATPLTGSVLGAVRAAAFARPAHYFDPLASPVLFLRSPGAVAPSPESALNDEFAELLGLADDEVVAAEVEGRGGGSKARKVPRRWPPAGMALRMPDVRVAVGEESPLGGQAEEMVRRLRGALVKAAIADFGGHFVDEVEEDEGVDAGLEEQRVRDAVAQAQRQITLHVARASGLWCERGSGDAWKEEVTTVGRWFRNVL